MDEKNEGLWEIRKAECTREALERNSSIFTVCNGYLSLKGNLLEDRGECHPTTFIAGVFDQADMVSFIRPTKEERRYLAPEYFDQAGPSPSVANLPNPLSMRVFVEGREISFFRGKVKGFSQRLHLREGLYTYQYDFEDFEGRSSRIRMARFCDMNNIHRVFMKYTLTPLNYSGSLRILSGIDGDIRSNLARDRQFHVTDTAREGPSGCSMRARTLARGIDIEMRVDTFLEKEEGSEWGWLALDRAAYRFLDLDLEQGRELVLEKCVAAACSEDSRHGVPCNTKDELAAAGKSGFDAARDGQAPFWEEAWGRADVEIHGHDLAQRHLRFCLYHLIAAAPRHTEKLSVPCKLLTGEHYQGTTFYDTDLYILPFYILTQPGWARNCVSFRYHGLEEGRSIAKDLGFRGAKFAWQAGPRGEEALGKWWRFTRTNVHINGDVAYSLLLYNRATGDDLFLYERGVDILVESARFYLSRLSYDEEWDQYDLEDVTGPDEGHCGCTNNFYTNTLVYYTLMRAAELLEGLRETEPDRFSRVQNRLHIEKGEPEQWRKVAENITLLFNEEASLYEQCEGFFDLPHPPEDLLKDRRVWFVTVHPYQAMNQPDVVVALVLFRDGFSEEVKRANWEYYRDKSMNFSSMSFGINAVMAADLGEMEEAYRNFLISAGEDLDEELTGRGDTAEGIHGTGCGGAWMAAVFGFGGVCLSKEKLLIRPRLPEQWKSLRFRLILRGEELDVFIDRNTVRVKVGKKADLSLDAQVGDKEVVLQSGKEVEVIYLK